MSVYRTESVQMSRDNENDYTVEDGKTRNICLLETLQCKG